MRVDFDSLSSSFGKLKESSELKDYLDNHKGAYLVSAFVISSPEDLEQTPWIFEYYWPENKKVITFQLLDGWAVSADDDMLQKDGRVLEELDLGLVKVKNPLENVEVNAPIKIIAILRSENSNPSWNISVFTREFNVVNCRIDAVTGERTSSKVDNLFTVHKS